jgi:hypothetical protein
MMERKEIYCEELSLTSKVTKKLPGYWSCTAKIPIKGVEEYEYEKFKVRHWGLKVPKVKYRYEPIIMSIGGVQESVIVEISVVNPEDRLHIILSDRHEEYPDTYMFADIRYYEK